ncbi:hypothetical protein LPUS_11014 [Lasallia pustulata]|uniref:Uncharacterized protein n=1 Tax=Lasallia pustulata TaxID=136370 RepID=A0A1W5DAV0_9LECA|nr:hypothetical protein LPUS_11014 [Lasallia pustulata]
MPSYGLRARIYLTMQGPTLPQEVSSSANLESAHPFSSDTVMSAGLSPGNGGNAGFALHPDGPTVSKAEEADLATAIAASLMMLNPNGSDAAAWVPMSKKENSTYERQKVAMRHSIEIREEQESRAGIQSSLEEISEPTEAVHHTEGAPSSLSAGASDPRRELYLKERIENMAFYLAMEIHMLNDPNGDTYVFIDPPAQQPEQDYYSYQRYCERYALPLCMQKKKFMTLDSFFDDAFGPTAQYRVTHRRRLVGRLPDSIKYVLDLTPPTEGDYAAYLTAELCCPEGVRRWYQAGQRWNVSSMLIGGQEEYSAPFRMREDSVQKVDDGTSSATDLMDVERGAPPAGSEELNLTRVIAEQQVDDAHSPTIKPNNATKDKPIPLEYSPVRHRSAIERVLHAAVEGLDPRIDSAPKLWTTFAVAKHYGIKRSALTDYIVRWLRANPNSYFLEVLPEISLRISDGLECSELCRDTFAILVGEEALANVYRCRESAALPAGRSVHGRKREDLPESYQTRIEYASKAFMERITAEFSTLVDEQMSWLNDLPEFYKLSVPELGHAVDRPDFSELMTTLKAFLRGLIYWILCNNGNSPSGPLADSASDGDIRSNDLFPTTKFSHTWRQLLPCERIFTRSFWKLLRQSNSNWGFSNICGASGYPVSQNNWPEAAKKYAHMGIIKEIRREHLDTLARDCNFIYRGHPQVIASQKSQATSPPPSSGSSFQPSSDGSNGGSRQQTQVSLPIRTQQLLSRTQFRKILPKMPAEQRGSTGVSTGVQAAPSSPSQYANASSLATEWPSRTSPSPSWTHTSYDPDLYGQLTQAQASSIPDPTPRDEFFDLKEFFNQADGYLGRICSRILAPPDASMRADTLELMLTDTLVCLEDPEWKYLPMWAGGNDDESGGVFDDQIPLAHTGFSTAGPRVHTGVGSSAASSEFEVISNQTDGSTHHTSTVVNDGFTDVMDRRRVYEADSIWSDVMADRDDGNSVRSKGADTATIHGSEFGWQDFMGDLNGEGTGKVRTEDKGKGKMLDDEEMFDDVFTEEDDDDDDENEEDEEEDDENDNTDDHSLVGNNDGDVDDEDMVLV